MIKNEKNVLGECSMNSTLVSSVVKMKDMKLMKPK